MRWKCIWFWLCSFLEKDLQNSLEVIIKNMYTFELGTVTSIVCCLTFWICCMSCLLSESLFI